MEKRERRLKIYQELTGLLAAGHTQSEASRQLGVGLRTVQRWLACGVFPERKHRVFPSIVDSYGSHLEKRYAEGCRNITYLKVRGRWVYLYRALDRDGNTVDFRLSPRRDVATAEAFFRKALRTQGRALVSITQDGYATSHHAVREMLNDNRAWEGEQTAILEIPEQSERAGSSRIKSRTRHMLGIKNFDCAATTIAGIERLQRIGKNHFSLRRFLAKDQTAPTIWNAVLAA